jgi:hypothetical protein
MRNCRIKAKSIAGILAVCMLLVLTGLFTGCSGTAAEDSPPQNTQIPEVGNSADALDKAHIDPSDYVVLGDYEGFEVRVDGLDVYVGEMLVSIPYSDEGFGTEQTLQYYYSQMNPSVDRTDWEIPADEDVARMGIPGIMSFSDLKDYVVQKINENDEITSFMLIGDAIMEQVVADSSFKKIPEDVIWTCEDIYTNYLQGMSAQYNEIGDIPVMQKGKNCAYKILAAMAIAEETGIGMDVFDYEKVLKYLVE